MSRAPKIIRRLRPTLLVVGEGDAECLLLGMLRDELCSGRRGPSVIIRNAKGMGARGVIQDAIRIARQGSYGSVAALFDTDTDWNDSVRAIGTRAKIRMLTQTPCLEALVLAINGQQRQGDTAFYKREFERLYAGPAHVKLRDCLRVADLIAAGARMPEVQALLSIYE